MTKRHMWVAPPKRFAKKLTISIAVGIFLITVALAVGMWGYHYYEKMTWVDAFVNAAMILSGMGPMGNLVTDQGKIFAGTYALFSGLGFILIMGIIFAPIVHRFFHRMNIGDDE